MTTLEPGYPGRGYDPTGSFTALQWYLFHQRNVAFFAAFSADDHDTATALELVRHLLTMLPHLAEGFRASAPLDDARLARSSRSRRSRILPASRTVGSMTGLPSIPIRSCRSFASASHGAALAPMPKGGGASSSSR